MYNLIILLGLLYELLAGRRRKNASVSTIFPKDTDAFFKSLPVFIASVGGTVLLFALSLALIRHAAADPQNPAWFTQLPIPAVYYDMSFWNHPYRQTVSLALLFTNIASCATLYALYRSVKARGLKKLEIGIILISYVCCLFLSIHSPALDSTDAYLYLQQGALGTQAYSAHHLSASCDEDWCKQAMFNIPSLYGPLFLTYLHIVLAHAPRSTLARIAILRFTGACWLTLLLLTLSLLRCDPPLIIVAALNPALLLEYVSDAHNDVVGAALVMVGILFVRRAPILALLSSAAASLVKLPFILIGLVPFLIFSLRPRIAWGTASLIASLSLVSLWSGKAYMQSLHYYGNANLSLTANHIVAVFCALILFAVTFLSGRIYLMEAYLLPTLNSYATFPWYAIWSFPYLYRDQRKAAAFLISLPLTAYLMNTTHYSVKEFWYVLTAALFIALFTHVFRNDPSPSPHAHDASPKG